MILLTHHYQHFLARLPARPHLRHLGLTLSRNLREVGLARSSFLLCGLEDLMQ